ncbi:MAG: hypothetical protein WD490_06690 [Opitutales bacterium]
MSLRSHPNTRHRPVPSIRVLLLAFAVCCGPVLRAETPGQIFLIDGKVVSGWIQRVDDDGVIWKIPSGKIGTFPLQNVQEMRLMDPADFRTAVRQLDSDPNEEAVTVLTTYADPENPDSYYPVPGNLAGKAAHILFRHYQTRGRIEEAAAWALRYEPELSPQMDRPPLLDLYRALASPPPDDFFERARERLKENTPEQNPEIEYLIAVARDLRGEYTRALTAYARVFSPSGGVLNPHGEFAISRAVRLLETHPPETLSQPARLIESLQKTRDLLYISP